MMLPPDLRKAPVPKRTENMDFRRAAACRNGLGGG